MDGTISSILKFFLDKTTSFGVKTAIFISIVGLAVIIDMGFGISYNAHVTNKIEHLKSIQSLKSNYRSDTLKLAQIKNLEEKIINRHHYSDFLRLDRFISSDKSNTNDQNANQSDTPITTANKPIFSTFWMVVSSCFFLLAMTPFLIFLPLFPNVQMNRKSVTGWIALNIIWAAMIVLITFIAYQIPLVFGNPTYNYVLNAVIHTSFILFIGILTKKKK